MTGTDKVEATKKRLADEKAAREKKQAEQREAMANAKPTPTQEENDLAAEGEHLDEHEPDGSPPDPNAPRPGQPSPHHQTRETKPSPQPAQRGDYSTRTSAPAPAGKHDTAGAKHE
ncbi:hypothetical protein [Bradyrhizobium septentrionale]|uniref:Uncharacterized protein n=1 Tax=Bradyrhizobium septentrionale TaxID=1404411 RepID=A0ABZ2P8Z1_9BRAD